MTTPSKSQTDIPSVDGLNTVTPETINEAALQYVYAVGDVDTAYVADEPEANPILTIMPVGEGIVIGEEPLDEMVDPVLTIMPVGEGIVIGEEPLDEMVDPVLTIMPVGEGIVIGEEPLDEMVDPVLTIMPVGEGIVIGEEPLDEMGGSKTDGEVLETPSEDVIDLELVDPIFTIMPVDEGIVIGEAPLDEMADSESDGEALETLPEDLTDLELVDPIFTIMPVDEGIIIDEVIFDETVDGEVIETPPEDIIDLVLVDPIFTIMPVDDYIFLDDMETIPEDSGFYEEVIDVVADTDPLDLLVMEKPFILDWSRDRDDEGNGDISLDNLDIPAPEQTFVSILTMFNLTAEDIVFSTEEPVVDKEFTDIDAGAATEITLLGLPETIEFIA